jgi:uncharacterized SAM-binding protein YcdF (DUF218 family)
VRDRIARWLERPLVVGAAVPRGGEAPVDAIIVLGAPVGADGAPTAALTERITAAAAAYAAGAAPLVVPTGGVTRRAARAEAAVIADELVARGVPRDAIRVEDRAQTTAQNAAFVAVLLGDGRRRVWLVTQPFHGRRARWLFRRAGFEPRVWHIAGSRVPLAWIAREYAAWVRAILTRGR